MRYLLWIILALTFSLATSACQPSPTPTPTPNAHATETQIASNIFATQTASAPTPTGTFTPTLVPSPTSTSTPTLVPSPTSTARPTSTPTVARTDAPTAEVVVTSTVEPGWTLYELRTSKLAVAIPSHWIRLDLSAPGLENTLAAAVESNPNYKGTLSSQTLRSMVASGIKFYAIDLTPGTQSPAYPLNMNILKMDTGIALPLDVLVPATVTQLTNIADPSVPITHRRVSLSGLSAEEFKYRAKFNAASGNPIVVSTTQYLTIQGTVQYVITFICPVDSADANVPVFEKIASTFRILN